MVCECDTLIVEPRKGPIVGYASFQGKFADIVSSLTSVLVLDNQIFYTNTFGNVINPFKYTISNRFQSECTHGKRDDYCQVEATKAIIRLNKNIVRWVSHSKGSILIQ